MIRSAVCGVALTCALSGCALRPAGLHAYAAPAPPSAEQTLAEVSRLRGLPLDVPVDFAVLDEAPFLEAFHAQQAAQNARRAAYFDAFTMARPTVDVGVLAEKMYEDDLDGFYDPRSKRLYLRRRAKPGAEAALRFTLAHEEEHALQDRYFGVPDMAAIGDVDQMLAVKALYEGDATLAAVLLKATREGSTSEESIARVERLTARDDASLLRASGVHPPKDAPPWLQTRLLWPYFRGAAFTAQLAASGGWALVNAAMRNPPKTTEQVLHIEKYVAGEGAVEIQLPHIPDGYTAVEHGRMGELQTRFFLAECMKDAEAAEAATGWGGDIFGVVARGKDRALLWSTAWDDDHSAERFAAGLEARRSCARTGQKPAFTVSRAGKRVAFVQGLENEAARAGVASELVALASRTPPSLPPVGDVRLNLHPPAASDFAEGGFVARGRFVDPVIGVESDLVDLTPRANNGLELSASGEFVMVGLSVMWAPPSLALRDATMTGVAEGLRNKHTTEPVLDEGKTRVALSWTQADERAVRVGDRLEVRVVFAPACEGKMTIALVMSWKPGTYGEHTAATWLASVKAAATSPACEALKTLRDPLDGAK